MRPVVTLKAAVSLDGRTATRTGDSKWITGEAARRHAHQLRADAGAVLVGVGTVLADDPRLTLHMLGSEADDPIRVVLDTHLRTPATSQLVTHGSRAPTLIFHGPEASPAARAGLSRDGVGLVELPAPSGRVDLGAALDALGALGLSGLLVEGGTVVHSAFLDAGLADRLAIFVAPVVLGDRAARPLFDLASPAHVMAGVHRLRDVRTTVVGQDVLIEGSLR